MLSTSKANKIKYVRCNSRASVNPFVNEPTLTYKKGTPERKDIEFHIKKFREQPKLTIPLVIGGKEILTEKKGEVRIPHEHKTVLAEYHMGGEKEVNMAIESALAAKLKWQEMSFEHRASIFLKIAELIAGPYRGQLNAATVLGQGKNFMQAEVDSACESIDFLRYNIREIEKLLAQQPISSPGMWNRLEYRPLEGFIYAVTPFNFTAIAVNLCLAPAMFGNVIVWKPSAHAMLSAHVLLQIFKEAGLPDGVVNFVPGNPEEITRTVLANKHFAGLHYTGSTAVFNSLNEKIAANLNHYVSYPRIVGETGGKDFIFAHSSADIQGLAVGLIRGAFEYAGQKCSACSRAYIPKSLWSDLKEILVREMKIVKMGNPEDPTVLVNSVIHEGSANKVDSYLSDAKKDSQCQILCGGNVDKSEGWFVEPTIVVVSNPKHKLMSDELFAPVLTIYVYEDDQFESTLELCDSTSEYALTGAFWARDREVIEFAEKKLRYSAGNFYINDKPTGAVVGQQPFGGGRSSGTNDKAGSPINLLRWTSVRAVKETLISPKQWTYPYMIE